ncbi:MAG: hypothetical protein RR410_04830 [Alistipes sp.]
MGLRLQEFEALTPMQFNSVYEQWRSRQDGLSRERWEIARMVALFAVSPYTKKKLKVTDLLRFAWEQPSEPQNKVEHSTQERFEQIRDRWK